MIRFYLEHIQNLQQKLLFFLENDDTEESYQNLEIFFNDIKIRSNQQDLKLFLHLLAKISDNHNRNPNFFSKIEKILDSFKCEITSLFSNHEIFNIFKSNKRLLLYFIRENIIILDEYMLKLILTDKYKRKDYFNYFLPEIKNFIQSKNPSIFLNDMQQKLLLKKLPNNFEENRKIGENDNRICQLIQNDSLDDFISYINQKKISLNAKIKKSIYETNSFLLKKESSLITYAAFFGSIQILKYLILNKAEVNYSIWLYAIHSNRQELILFLLENKIQPKNHDYYECFIESIKCHHNGIVNYFIQSGLYKKDKHDFTEICKSFNFLYFEEEFINQSNFNIFCKYDYVSIVEFFVKNTSIDIKNNNVFNQYFFNEVLI